MKRVFVLFYMILLTTLVSLLLYLSFALFEQFSSTTITTTPIYLTSTKVTEQLPLPALPRKLLIPSIGVNATIEQVGLSLKNSGEMAAPSNFTDVAWYMAGARPGEKGSAVIAGHLNGKNIPQAVFYNLATLELGDNIFVVTEDGATLTFVVVRVRTYHYTDNTDSVFIGDPTKARLNLITCAGGWIANVSLYEKRTVVFTELVSDTITN